MTTVVLDSKDLVASLEGGKIIEPKEVVADREGPKPVEKPKERQENGEDDFAKRLGLTKEQHDAITEVVDKAVKKAVGSKTRQLRETEEFAAEQVRRVKALEDARASAPKADELVRPKRETFKTVDEYENALLDWRDAVRRKEDIDRAAKAEHDSIVAAATERYARGKFVADFEQKAKAVIEALKEHPALADYLQRAEMLPELLYHFGDNPKEFDRIKGMPTRSWHDTMKVGVAISKIEDKLKPFAEMVAETADAKASNGAKPSKTESALKAAAKEDAGPSTETESDSDVAGPSEPRETAPVIKPLSSPSTSQVDNPSRRSTREEIEAFRKRHGADLRLRKRH